MLRRIANHLFWMARNIERAEWRARLADVNYHLLLEAPPRSTDPWDPLLAIFGEREEFRAHYDKCDEESVLNFFTLDRDNPNSIVNCLSIARENARAIRHTLSSEMWVEINSLFLECSGWTAEVFRNPGVYDFFAALKDGFYRLAGIRHNTMPRDLAWEFMQLGLMLERAEDVSRMLDVKYHYLLPQVEHVGGDVDLQQWAAVLRSASGLEAYRRRFGNSINVRNVVDMLALDPAFPRSARFAIEATEKSLETIALARRGCDAGAPPLAGSILAELRQSRADDAMSEGLHEFMLRIQDSCADIYARVRDRYLRIE